MHSRREKCIWSGFFSIFFSLIPFSLVVTLCFSSVFFSFVSFANDKSVRRLLLILNAHYLLPTLNSSNNNNNNSNTKKMHRNDTIPVVSQSANGLVFI